MFNIKNLFRRRNSINSNIIYENHIVRDEINSWCKDIGLKNINDLFIMIGMDTSRKIYLYQDYDSRNNIKLLAKLQ